MSKMRINEAAASGLSGRLGAGAILINANLLTGSLLPTGQRPQDRRKSAKNKTVNQQGQQVRNFQLLKST